MNTNTNTKLPTIEVSSKLAYLQPGMYVVRLLDDAQGNVLMLSSTPVGRGTLDFFPGEGVSRNALTRAGDCIVVRVNGALAPLLLTEFQKPGQKQRLTLKIDRVLQENLKETLSPSQASNIAQAGSQQKPLPSVRQFGHIQAVGDTVVQDAWLGDPTSTRRIEGFAIGLMGLPDSLGLSYGALIQGSRHYVNATSGQFVGTRQKSKSLVGVFFDLSGDDADQYVLTGQVVFSGQAPQTIQSGQPVTGPTGTEPLVALRLVVIPKSGLTAGPAAASEASGWNDPQVTTIKKRRSPKTHQ